MPSDGVVLSEAQFKKEAGLQSWFSKVVYQVECERGPLETSKL